MPAALLASVVAREGSGAREGTLRAAGACTRPPLSLTSGVVATETTESTESTAQKVLKLSRKVDDCKPLVGGQHSVHRPPGVPVVPAVRRHL